MSPAPCLGMFICLRNEQKAAALALRSRVWAGTISIVAPVESTPTYVHTPRARSDLSTCVLVWPPSATDPFWEARSNKTRKTGRCWQYRGRRVRRADDRWGTHRSCLRVRRLACVDPCVAQRAQRAQRNAVPGPAQPLLHAPVWGGDIRVSHEVLELLLVGVGRWIVRVDESVTCRSPRSTGLHLISSDHPPPRFTPLHPTPLHSHRLTTPWHRRLR